MCHVLHTSDTAEIAHSSILRSLKIRLVGRFSLWDDRDWFDKKVAAGRFLCTVHILEVFGFRPLSPSLALFRPVRYKKVDSRVLSCTVARVKDLPGVFLVPVPLYRYAMQ